MSLNRHAQRRDANEQDLIYIARQMGAQMEKAPPMDWWCGWRGVWKPVEIKTKKGRYTDEQILFMTRCKEHGNPHLTWRTVNDVLASLDARQTA